MDYGVLAAKVKNSRLLSDLQDDIVSELQFQADDTFQFDPITIIMIISIIVQVIIHCRNSRDDDQIAQDIRDIRTLPPRQLMRLRRRLNRLWRDRCNGYSENATATNPIITSLYEIGERVDDDTLKELFKLADEEEENN